MTSVDVIDVAGAKSGSVELPANIFDVQANIPLMHQVVVAQLAAARQGTHKAKSRGEVSGGGRKPYKQKGTGRARQGSTRAPQFTGGGVVHGPVPRDYSQRTPKKMKAAALRGALSDRARDGRVALIETFVDGETPSTKAALAALAAVASTDKVLVVLSGEDEVNWISLRNVPTVHLLEASQLNTYDVLVADEVVFTTDALAEFLGAPLDIEAEDGYEPAAQADSDDDADSDVDADAADEDAADSDVDEADESSEESDK